MQYVIPLPVKVSNVPWDDKDIGIQQLEEAARATSPIVKLKLMELSEQQYSVYTIWSPTYRNKNESGTTKHSNKSERPDSLSNLLIGSPRRQNKEVQAAIKPRSPSVPRSKSMGLQHSPRSQSLPPDFPENCDSSLRHNAFIRAATPSIPVHSPMKAKFKEKFQQKEALVAVKKFGGNTLGKSSRIIQAIKDLTGSQNVTKVHRKQLKAHHKGKFTEVKDKHVEHNKATAQKYKCEKRKSEMDDNELNQKKIKYDKIEKCLHSSEASTDEHVEGKRFNELEFDDRSSDILPNPGAVSESILNSKHDSKTERSAQSITSEKVTDISKDISKTQPSILQYFTVK